MSTRPYVENVYSNLKSPRTNGDAWSIDIGQKTLLVGSNTSHKSTIVQAIELAIAGSADDIIGRSIVSDAALLLTLAPGDELGVTARFSNGNTASYNVRKEEGKVKRPKHDGPGALSLVHRSVAAALSGSATTARKAFLEWSSGDIDRADVLACLPSGQIQRHLAA
jgi:predicted ATPase